jgi:hypothetical protein
MKSKMFKRLLSISLCLIMVFSMAFIGNVSYLKGLLSNTSFAEINDEGTFGGNFKWKIHKEGSATLYISGTGEMPNVTYTPWRTYSSYVRTIKIYSGITSISDSAFSDCRYVKNIYIPKSVVNIGENAFPKSCVYYDGSISQWCKINFKSKTANPAYRLFINNLEIEGNIDLPDGMTGISNYAFAGNQSITSITIPDSVTSIDDCAFQSCTKLLNIIVDDENKDYRSIDGVLFNKDVTKLVAYPVSKAETAYSIPNGVTSIDNCAFYDCTSLTSVTFPENIISIGDDAFQNCSSIKVANYPGTSTQWSKISVGINNTYLINAIIYDYNSENSYYGKGAYGENVSWTLYTTGELIISGTGAMKDYTPSSTAPWYSYKDKIKKVTIEDGVTTVGAYAFYDCTSLTSATIGNGVTSIGAYAFYDCTSLTSATIGNGVTSIGYSAFEDCTGLTTIKIGGSVTSIGNFAFYDCTGLTSITIPDGVTSIGYSAFYGCTRLESVYYDGTPTEWSKISVGSDDSYLTSATRIYECNSDRPYRLGSCGDNVTYKFYTDGELVISGTGSMKSYFSTKSYSSSSDAPWHSYRDKIKKVAIEDGITTIGEYAFYDCTSLTSATIGNGVTSIDTYAFGDCTSLTSITIGNGVTSIGYSAFEDCTGLTTIKIGGSVTSIDSTAFEDCTSLMNITIPDSVTCVNYHTFEDTAYYNDETKWENGKVLYIGNHLVKAKDTLSGNYEIRKGTKVISDYAFFGCTSLTEIIIPDSVVTIGNQAFYGCSCLLSVSLGNGVKTIGSQAFSNCKSLKDVNLGNNITTIGGGAFNECTNIKSITIPDSVTNIGGGAFYKTGLTSVKIPRTVTYIGEGAFGSTIDFYGYIYDRDFTIYCEKGSEAHRYAAANDLNCVLLNDASTGNNSSNGSNSGGSSLSFFQRIIAFFKNIFNSIKNLFS